jgi:hypothetical protein
LGLREEEFFFARRRKMKKIVMLVLVLAMAGSASAELHFDFGPTVGGVVSPGYTQVLAAGPGTAPVYDAGVGYGYLAAGIVEGHDNTAPFYAYPPLEDCHTLNDETFRMDIANGSYTFEACGGYYPTTWTYFYLAISGDGGSTWTEYGADPVTGLARPYSYYAWDGDIDSRPLNKKWYPNPTYPEAYDLQPGHAWHVNNAPIEVTAGYILMTGLDDGGDSTFTALCTANVVPEPATMVLLSLGGLLLRRRR